METELLARGVAAEHAALAAELFDEADQAFPYLDPKEGSSDGFMSDWEEYYDATHQRFFYRRRNGNGTWAVPPALQFQQWCASGIPDCIYGIHGLPCAMQSANAYNATVDRCYCQPQHSAVDSCRG